MRLLVIAPRDFAALDVVRSDAQGVEIIAGDNADSLRDSASSADAVLLAPRSVPALTDLWRDLAKARWIHTLSAGVESLPFDLLRRSTIIVTNSRGIYADALGEFAVAAMLWFAKDLRRLIRQQAEHLWKPYPVERLEGATVGVIGYGGIGRAVARRAEALDMRVLPVRRRTELGDPSIDEVVAESDYLVVATPLTPATFRLISRERIGRMKPNSVLINVSRGAVIDEAALVDALRAKRIRGAALDVFEKEPLPPDHVLWTLDNVLIAPHSADYTADSHLRAMAFFVENLKRFQRGEPLENVVDKDEQY